VTLLGKKISLTGGDYFTALYTRNNTPNAATAVSRGCAITNWSFIVTKL